MPGPAAHFKVNFPPAGESDLVLPEWGPDGPIQHDGQQRPVNRTYTPRRWDPEAKELTVDFLLHGEGIGSTWAQQAQPGQVIAVSQQPGGAYKVDGAADWYLIGGDEAAHRAARGRYLGADGDGALCRNDCSTARRLDDGAGRALALLIRGQRDRSLVTRQAFCRARWVIPNNSPKLKQQNRALTLKT